MYVWIYYKQRGPSLELRKACLKAKLAKGEFLKSKIYFIGHKVDGDDIQTIDDKITTIGNFNRGSPSKTYVLSLGCVVTTGKLINSFTKLASPLKQLLKKEVKFHCKALQERSFNDLKEALINLLDMNDST